MQARTARSTRELMLVAVLAIALAWFWPVSMGLKAFAPIGATSSHSEPLSVLTYNVHGLPWPIASGRPEAIREISAELLELRRQGRQPSVVVLQEAFTPEAKRLGKLAGYPFVVAGPSRELDNKVPPSSSDLKFAASGRWLKGEQLGRFYDSGLMVLSDLPVLDVKRIAFPMFACAGYDCLANKGALMVTIKDERTGLPVQIVTSHLNSRHSSYVPDARSFYAYGRQLAVLNSFIEQGHIPSAPLIVAGDLNASSPGREDLLRRTVASWEGAREGDVRDALHFCASPSRPCGAALNGDALTALHHGRDWQFFAAGSAAGLRVAKLEVPFGHGPNGKMLSDHIGYSVTYEVDATKRGNPQPIKPEGALHAGVLKPLRLQGSSAPLPTRIAGIPQGYPRQG